MKSEPSELWVPVNGTRVVLSPEPSFANLYRELPVRVSVDGQGVGTCDLFAGDVGVVVRHEPSARRPSDPRGGRGGVLVVNWDGIGVAAVRPQDVRAVVVIEASIPAVTLSFSPDWAARCAYKAFSDTLCEVAAPFESLSRDRRAAWIAAANAAREAGPK